MAPLEVCKNCGRTIGNLEMPYLWNLSVVCWECYERLQIAPLPYASPIPPQQFAPAKYVDSLYGVRLACLLIGIVFWPLLLVWLVLGIYHLVQKNQA